MKLFVTGGAGFIGSQFIRDWMGKFPESTVVNFDKLTYAGNLANLAEVETNPNYQFVRGDVCDRELLLETIPQGADAIVHFAAESHVDRSIAGASEFIRANVMGTQVLLDAARERKVKRFLHISTDEVGGSMGPGDWFTEECPLDPSNPYAASKAAAEHLVRAAGATFGLDYVITRTGNNYGPYQFPEKLLPLAICNAMGNLPIPVYGDGQQVRDWVHVSDNCRALQLVLRHGKAGETYHIGGGKPQKNLDVLKTLLSILGCDESLLTRVADRPGHDVRYAVDFRKIERDLSWRATTTFHQGLSETIEWYRQNSEWIRNVRNGEYLNYYQQQYGLRAPAATVIAQ